MMPKTVREKIGSQGGESEVAYRMGRECPIGQEITLILGLESWWPDLPSRPEAKKALLRGLSDRFKSPPAATPER